jgi:tetratricopeptide (TPR) repeat protein
VAQLAYHFGEAADTDLEKAIGYAQRAAAEATDVHSYEEAAAHCERALEWLDASGVPNDRLRCELLISLAQVQLRYIGYTTSRETIRSALEPARALGDHDLIARVALTFAGRYGVPGRADPEIVSVLEDALALMDEAEIGLRAGLTSRLGIEYMLPDPARAAELTMEGLRLADEYGDPNVQAVSLWDYSWIFAETDPVVDDWLKLAANLRRYGIEGGDAWVAVAGRWFDMYSELLRGNLDEAKLARDTYLREAVEFRVMQGRYFEALSAAMFALFEGRIEEADVLVHRALAVGQETEEPLAMNQYGAQLLILRWLQGRSVELIPMLQTLISTDPHVPWWAALALCQAMSDQLDDARSTIEDHLSGGIGSLRLGANRVVALGTVAIVAWMLRDERWAEDLYAALLPLEGLNTLIGVPGAISLCGSHYLAMLSSLTDRWEDYDRHVNDAFEMYDRMSARPWKMLLQGEVAVDLSRRGRPGDQGRAAEVLESAITGGRELGVDIDSILKPVTKDLKAHL